MTAPDRWIVIPRWDEFQHRDMARSSQPPWIKTYTRLADDDDYLSLSLMQRGVLHGLWILYARHRRVLSEAGARQKLVSSAAEARRWRDTMVSLSDAGFIAFVASKPASRYASNLASLEVEVEEEPKAVLLPRPPTPADQNGTASEHNLEEIAALIDATLPDWQP